MAKDTKKNSKKSKTSTNSEEKLAPPIDPGMVNVAISETDLVTFANLMSICAKTFEQLAIKAAEQNDEASFRTLQARYQLSSAFAQKLVECTKMPEPISREVH